MKPLKPYDPAWGISVGKKIQRWANPLGLCPYYPSPDAPSTYEVVLETMRASHFQGLPYPVYSGGCETSIYGSVGTDANHAFRFMHDWMHAHLGLGFDLASELQVAAAQRTALFLFDEEEWVFLIDTQGQALYYFLTDGEFLKDQGAFVHWVYEGARRMRRQSSEEEYNDAQILQQAVYAYYLEHKQ